MSSTNDNDIVARFLQTARKYIKTLPDSILALAEDVKPEVAEITVGMGGDTGGSEPKEASPEAMETQNRAGAGLVVPKIEPIDTDEADDDNGDLEDGEIADSDDERSAPAGGNAGGTARGNGGPSSVPQCPPQPPSNNSPKRRLCRYFREGFCRNGINCKFLHSAVDSGAIPELCRAYAFGKCPQPNTCKRLHGEYPCLAFHRGKCETPRCRFSHHPPDDYTLNIIEKQSHQNHPYKPFRKVLLPTPPPAVPSRSSGSNSNFTPLPLVQATRRWTEDPLIPQIMSLPSKSDAQKKPLTVKEINTMIKILADESCPDDYFDSVIEEYWPKPSPYHRHASSHQHQSDSWVDSQHSSPEVDVLDCPPNRKCRRAAEHRRSAPYPKKVLIEPKKEPMSPPVPLLPSHPVQPFNVLNPNAFAFGPPPPLPLAVTENDRQVLDRLAAQQIVMSQGVSENRVRYESCDKPVLSPWTTPPPPLLCHELPAFDPRRPPPPLPLNMLYSTYRS